MASRVFLAFRSSTSPPLVCDVDGMNVVRRFPDVAGAVISGSWSLSGDCVAFGTNEHPFKLSVVSLADAIVVVPCYGHSGSINKIGFSESASLNFDMEKVLISASTDCTLRLWRPHTGTQLKMKKLDDAVFSKLVWFEDSVYFGDFAGIFRGWDLNKSDLPDSVTNYGTLGSYITGVTLDKIARSVFASPNRGGKIYGYDVGRVSDSPVVAFSLGQEVSSDYIGDIYYDANSHSLIAHNVDTIHIFDIRKSGQCLTDASTDSHALVRSFYVQKPYLSWLTEIHRVSEDTGVFMSINGESEVSRWSLQGQILEKRSFVSRVSCMSLIQTGQQSTSGSGGIIRDDDDDDDDGEVKKEEGEEEGGEEEEGGGRGKAEIPASCLIPPHQFIRFEAEEQRFVINPQYEKDLCDLPQPLYVIAVCGRYRTGKSFLLNRLLATTDEPKRFGFPVGRTIEAATRGLWLWAKKINGRTYVLLDTEGLDVPKNSASNFDNNILSLAVLLSSMFVLNTQGSIDPDALNRLEFVVELAKSISLSSSHPTELEDYSQFFPDFVWLVRDFFLELRNEGGKLLSDNEYLEDVLAETTSDDDLEPAMMALEKSKKYVRSVFPRRSCFTLMTPVKDSMLLRRMSEMEYTDLDAMFRDKFDALRKAILDENDFCPKKQHCEIVWDGRLFFRMAEEYVDHVNSGDFVFMDLIYGGVRTEHNQQIFDECRSSYQSELRRHVELDGGFPFDRTDLDAVHFPLLEQCSEQIRSMCYPDVGGTVSDEVKRFRNQIAVYDDEKKLQGGWYLKEIVTPNERESLQKCSTFLKTNWLLLVDKFDEYVQDPMGVQQFEAKLSEIRRQFQVGTKMGPSQTSEFLQHFLKQHEMDCEQLRQLNEYFEALSRQRRSVELSLQQRRGRDVLDHSLVKSWLEGLPTDPAKVFPWDSVEKGAHISSGGYGMVYEGVFHGRAVAVKELKAECSGVLQMIMREFELANNYHSPSLIDCFGYSLLPKESQGIIKVRIIMELMKTDLSDFTNVKSEKFAQWDPLDLTLDQKFTLLEMCSSAIEFLHSENMIHRDIKAMNFLLSGNLSEFPSFEPRVVLTDFGLSRQKNTLDTRSMMTAQRGTLMWMAPEMFQIGTDDGTGSGRSIAYGQAVDLYSFAMTMYEVLYGCFPYRSRDEGDLGVVDEFNLVSYLMKGRRPMTTSLRKACPEFADLIEKLWSRPIHPEFAKIGSVVKWFGDNRLAFKDSKKYHRYVFNDQRSERDDII